MRLDGGQSMLFVLVVTALLASTCVMAQSGNNRCEPCLASHVSVTALYLSAWGYVCNSAQDECPRREVPLASFPFEPSGAGGVHIWVSKEENEGLLCRLDPKFFGGVKTNDTARGSTILSSTNVRKVIKMLSLARACAYDHYRYRDRLKGPD